MYKPALAFESPHRTRNPPTPHTLEAGLRGPLAQPPEEAPLGVGALRRGGPVGFPQLRLRPPQDGAVRQAARPLRAVRRGAHLVGQVGPHVRQLGLAWLVKVGLHEVQEGLTGALVHPGIAHHDRGRCVQAGSQGLAQGLAGGGVGQVHAQVEDGEVGAEGVGLHPPDAMRKGKGAGRGVRCHLRMAHGRCGHGFTNSPVRVKRTKLSPDRARRCSIRGCHR